RIRCLQLKLSVDALDLIYDAAEALLVYFQTKAAIRFQQHALSSAQALADRPVHRLAEITAFRMLQMGFPAEQRDAQITDQKTAQHSDMFLFTDMGQDQTLPGGSQYIL